MVSPHYVEEEKEIVDEFAAKSGLKVLPFEIWRGASCGWGGRMSSADHSNGIVYRPSASLLRECACGQVEIPSLIEEVANFIERGPSSSIKKLLCASCILARPYPAESIKLFPAIARLRLFLTSARAISAAFITAATGSYFPSARIF